MNTESAVYYDETYFDYVRAWSDQYIHYGFWYDDTKTHEESLINPIKEIIKHLDLKPGDRVLDAGCGTGGVTRYIAENINIETIGITLSEEMLKAGKEQAKNIKNKNLFKIYLKDFTNTGFKDGSFTKILGIESICHADDKNDFIQEAHRLLKIGGKLAVMDFYLLKNDLNEQEKNNYQKWLDGWSIPGIDKIEEFKNKLELAGFKNIHYYDKTTLIKKSSQIMYEGAQKRLFTLLEDNIKNDMPKSVMAHNLAGYVQKDCIEKNIWGYGIFVADK